jgi:FtsP/CotA-like multicopper oxidase with cupredoxin domain
MLDFNLWTFNSRAFPGIDSLNVRQNDRVRIRVGNLTMTNHPIHLHGHEFTVTGTDGGPTPKGALAGSDDRHRRRADAPSRIHRNEAGDWAFHCHKSHHTMNAMGHDVPTMIGVDHREAAKQITDLIPTTW